MSKTCPDCGAVPGDLHFGGCDVERCPDCGGQVISCGCEHGPPQHPRLPWTGEWPGVAECREYGWYCTFDHKRGWRVVGADEPGAREDLNRLVATCNWDAAQGRFVKREG
jgi:hypothetical protein